MLEHLFFKALFGMAANRAQYLSLLLSTESFAVGVNSTLPDLLSAARKAARSEEVFRKSRRVNIQVSPTYWFATLFRAGSVSDGHLNPGRRLRFRL